MKRRLLPEFVSEFKDRHGKVRVRFRRKGHKTYYFKAQFGTEDFRSEYRACLDGVAAPAIEVAADRRIPGSIGDLLIRYYKSPAWQSPQEVTRHKNHLILERFRAEHGHRMVRELRPEHLDAIFGRMASTPTAANTLRKLLKRVMHYARKIGMRKDNPVELTEAFKVKTDGFHTWTEEEIEQFEVRHPIGTKPHLALGLMLYTGQRRSDAVRMGRQHVEDGSIRVSQMKTKHKLLIPVHWRLRDIIAATPNDHLTFLVTEYGKPFAAAGFGNWFRDRCDEAGLPQCSAHGLRKAAGRRMAEAGCTAHQIMAVLGVGLKEAMIYTAAADQKRLAAQGMSTLTASQMANQAASVSQNPAKSLKEGN